MEKERFRLAHRECAPGEGHRVGRELLAQLYWEISGNPLPEMGKTALGRPYFLDCPYFFSISHTKHHVFCAVSLRNIGIDAEEVGRAVNPKLAEKVLSESEKVQYSQASDKNKAFLTFWVLKEAAAKLAGTGLQGYPNWTQFRLDDPRVREEFGCLVAVIMEETGG